MGSSVAGPTGQVANTGTGFVLSNGTTSAPAAFIFDTLDGHIEAWNPKVDPLIGNTENKAAVPGASYTGLALASTSNGDELFAANFGQGKVDVFDSTFKQVTTASWQFRDPRLPHGFKPFNTQALNGNIFVTYDKADRATGREAVGPGLGIVDEFSTDGHLISRIASGGALNAPWGLAIAPSSWGSAAGSLLVGNFGDGRISIFAKEGGRLRLPRHGPGRGRLHWQAVRRARPMGPAARHRGDGRHQRALVHRGHQPRAGRPARRPASVTPARPGPRVRGRAWPVAARRVSRRRRCRPRWP